MESSSRSGFLIARIHQLSSRILARKLKENSVHELNPAQGRILCALCHHDGITMHELAVLTSLGNSTLTSMLDRLENAGYLSRLPCQDDRRKIAVKLSVKGLRVQTAFEQAASMMDEPYFQGFTRDEVDEFEGYLLRILENLSAREKEVQP